MSVDPFALWLVRHPELTLSGRDEPEDDVDDDVDDEDDQNEDEDDPEDDEDDEDSSEALKKKLKDSEKARAKAERALAKKNSAKPEDDEGDDEDPDTKALREENEGLRKLLNGPYIQSQIDSFKDDKGNPRWEWEDAETVYALLDRSELEVDIETGEIDGLEEQLEELAESKGHFLLKKALDDDSDEDDQPKPRRRRRSGNAPRGGSTRKTDKLSGEELAEQFNAIVQR